MSETLLIIVSLLAVALIAGLLWSRRRYDAALRMEHVQAFVDRIDSLRAAAFDRFDAPLSEGDPRTTVTRAGLAVGYTISSQGERYRHHLSVSPGGPATRPVGARFLLLGVRRLRVPDMEVGLGISPAGVFHAAWVLDAEQQARFVDRRPEPLDASTLATVFASCLDEAQRVKFEDLADEMGGREEGGPSSRS